MILNNKKISPNIGHSYFVRGQQEFKHKFEKPSDAEVFDSYFLWI